MKIHYTAIRFFTITALAIIMSQPVRPLHARSSREGQRILSISVFGNYRIKRDLVLEAFSLDAGDVYDYEAAKAGIANIESLHGVLGVRLEEIQNRREDGVRLLIIMTEKRAWTLRPLMRRSLTDRTSFGIGFSQMNFRGRNEQLHLSAMARGVTFLEAAWVRPPRPFGSRFGARIECSYSDYLYPFPDYRDILGDDRIRWFASSLSMMVRLPWHSFMTLSGGVEYIDAWEPGHTFSYLPVSPYGLFAALKASLKCSTLDSEFYPMNGIFASASRKEWGIAGSSRLNASVSELSGALFARKGWKPVLHLSCSLRSASRGAPYYLTGHLGGEKTVRGYEFGIFSGENTLLGRAELLVPLNFSDLSDLGNPMVLTELHLFLDSGAAWDHEEVLGQDDFHSGFGCGITFIPMRGTMLKIEAAWTLVSSTVFYFDISTGFGG